MRQARLRKRPCPDRIVPAHPNPLSRHYRRTSGVSRRLWLRRRGPQTRHHDHAGGRIGRGGVGLSGHARGRRVPNAKYLRIALLRPNSFSRGSFRSALGLSNSRVTIRQNGRLISVPVGRLQRAFDYGDGKRESVAVSWADVFTAYHSTGIRNIETYFEADFISRTLYQVGAGIADTVRLHRFSAGSTSPPAHGPRDLRHGGGEWKNASLWPRRRIAEGDAAAPVSKRPMATASRPKPPWRSDNALRAATSCPASRLPRGLWGRYCARVQRGSARANRPAVSAHALR